MTEGNSLRDVMKDHIRGCLADYHHIAESEVDCDMAANLADVVFDVMKIPEDKQDYPYKEYSEIIRMTPRKEGATTANKHLMIEEDKQAVWDKIHIEKKCPSCNAKQSMLKGSHGGLSVNIKCSVCGQKYCTSPFRGFGAEPI